MKPIYLDHNATAPIDRRVSEAIAACHQLGLANPASQHQPGRQARRLLEECREEIAARLGADVGRPGGPRLIFTSGGTESNNLALLGLVGPRGGRILISAIEHPSVVAAASELAGQGHEVVPIPVSPAGVVRIDQFEALLTDDTRLVSVMMANNETGVLQPVEEVARRCAARSILFHCDAVQAIGKQRVDFSRLSCATMSVTAHKLHGPVGIGALLLQAGVELSPILFGGQQQLGLRPGTESVALAVGMRETMRLWAEQGESWRAQMGQLRDRFEQQIVAALPDTEVVGQQATRLPHTSNLAFPQLDRQLLFVALDQAQVACSTGSSCASGSSQPSPVLLAMGLDPSLVEGALRFGLGTGTTAGEIDEAAERIIKVVRELRRQKDSQKTPGSSRHQPS